MRTIFHEKSFSKCGGETIWCSPFLKNLWINSPGFNAVCFYCMPSLGLSNYIETKLQITRFYLICKAFKNIKTPYDLRQKVGDKFTKLSKIGFSMECFTAIFLRFFTEKYQNVTFGWTAGYSPSNPSVSEVFLKFPSFLRWS